MGQPAGLKTGFSTACLDLVSDVTTIRSDVIFLPMYINPSIFSVISSPGPEVPVPGSLRKDRDTFGSRGHVFHCIQERHHSQKPTQGIPRETPPAHLKHIRIDYASARILEELKIGNSTSWVARLWAWVEPFDRRLADVVAGLRIH